QVKIIVALLIVFISGSILLIYMGVNFEDKDNANIVRKKFEKKLVNRYTSFETIGKNLNLSYPQDMVISNNDIYVVDSRNNRVLKIDDKGNLIKQLGGEGTGNGEFKNPIGITVDNNNDIYVADSGNNRVEVFDNSGKYIREVKVDDLSDKYNESISHIEVDNIGNIFLSIFSKDGSGKDVMVIKSNGRTNRIVNKMIGVLGKLDNRIFFATEYEVVKEKKSLSLQSGISNIIELTTGKILNKTDLPYSYTAKSITSYDGYLYLFSGSYKTIDKFDSNGSYIESVYQADINNDGLGFMTMDKSGNIYIVDYINNVIYKVSKNK
ncbi:MAG: NHL repeat-containing protein, partial [Bacillota bacterium]|nr:NHL repeat-containing protein [Bacillota bacterium]